ncbi:HupE/UreJ family protein [Paenibacillus sp. NPDC056579]|uniref:HupE/UreJ family protein n=1 Tax=Paenibacillus sp. NPDC056579 TaxID=3345871 RepID=UPI003691A6EE
MKNIFQPESKHAPWIAFAFGLIHGFGFAGILAELNLERRCKICKRLTAFIRNTAFSGWKHRLLVPVILHVTHGISVIYSFVKKSPVGFNAG